MTFTSAPENTIPSARFFLFRYFIQAVRLFGLAVAQLADVGQQPVHFRRSQGCTPRRHQRRFADGRATVLITPLMSSSVRFSISAATVKLRGSVAKIAW